MKVAWKEHYKRLLNVKFPWNPENLLEVTLIQLRAHSVMITKAISRMRLVEMLKPVGEVGAVLVPDLIVAIIAEGKIPSNWQESYIVSLYTGKGDALNRGNYRGLKLINKYSRCWSEL
jgi:hypothetical protein